MKLKLVENSGKLHKSSTVVLSVLLVVLAVLEIVQPYLSTLQPVISEGVYPWISAGLGIAIALGRYVKQNCLHVENKNELDS